LVFPVTDDIDPAPTQTSCIANGISVGFSPTFPIGDTQTFCHAVDASGNDGFADLTVHVKGAGEQINDLIDKVVDRFRLPPTLAASLRAQLKSAAAALLASDPGQTCTVLRNFKV